MSPQRSAANVSGDPSAESPSANISALSGDPAANSPATTMWQPNESIGSYKLVHLIGSGGMGEVWLAEQTQPVHRRVALKLIKAGMDTGEVVARFQSERQALALMDHPNIAKVFDAGSTPQGRPYFVMEYIPGIPITEYCDQHRMTLRERLELFLQVCEGVQHAHQKAIIHRDLKPSNILVSEVDGNPVPRIIDFGVAKAISHGVIAETLFTQTGAIVGTPAYMSPEQACSTGTDVDTCTDVYSLGVVLYELLVGVRPLELHELAFDEMLRRLREEEAPRPSTKLRTLGDEASASAENRRSDPATLVRQLHGDLDAIALKALEKDRSRRYGTPSDLTADIRRYLNNEAVIAVPPSTAYRARKFALRYHGALVAVGACALVLILGAAVSIWQGVRATKQRNRADAEAAAAQAVNDFLQNDLLAQASAANQTGSSAKPDPHLEVRTALDRAAVRVAGRFNRQPGVEAAVRDTIGHTYVDLGLYPEAQQQLERALDLHRRELGAEDPKTLKTMSRLGYVAYRQGRYERAEALYSQALEVQRRVLAPEHPDMLYSMNGLANVRRDQGKHPEAEALYSQTLEIRRRVLGSEHPDTLASMNNLAITYEEQGKYAQAETLHNLALETKRRVLGPEHPDTLTSMSNLAVVYDAQGKYSQAEAIYTAILNTQRRILGSDHPDTLDSMNNLADAYNALGKYTQAEVLLIRTLETKRRVLGSEHPDTLMSMHNLCLVYESQGKYSQAEALFKHTLELKRRVLGLDHPATLGLISDFASMYQRQGKYAVAETYAARAVAGRRHTLGSEELDTMLSVADLALAYLSQGKFAESEPLAREALEFNRKKQPDEWQRFRAESLLGASLAGQKKYAEAEPLLLEGYRGMLQRKDRIGVPDWYHLDRSREWIAQFYKVWDKPEKAVEWRKK
jgi:serine/threonine protein kinase/Tfp pilus assembly protein PilF